MASWVLLCQYGFILGLWLSLAIISIPWGYMVSEPLLALRSGVEDLIYSSQGLRDHPARLLHRIMLGPLVLLLKGRRKRWCNMQLHTCQTASGLVIPEEWSTEGNTFRCILCHALLGPEKQTGILSLVVEDVIFRWLWKKLEDESIICYKEELLSKLLQFEMLLKCCWSMNLGLLNAWLTFWHDEISPLKQKKTQMLWIALWCGGVTTEKNNKWCSVLNFF